MKQSICVIVVVVLLLLVVYIVIWTLVSVKGLLYSTHSKSTNSFAGFMESHGYGWS